MTTTGSAAADLIVAVAAALIFVGPMVLAALVIETWPWRKRR
jgi:hypothetical protein